MWETFGTRTVKCMARGTRYLAKIWEGAWGIGKAKTKIGKGSILQESDLMRLYNDPKFVPSVRLDQYKAILRGL